MEGFSTRRLIGVFGTVAVAQVLVRVRMLLMIPLLIKGLGVRDYGVWVLFVGAVAFLSGIVSLGMPQALERFMATAMPTRDIRERFFSAVAIVCLAGGGALLLMPVAGPWAA